MANSLKEVLEELPSNEREQISTYIYGACHQLLKDMIGHRGLYADLSESVLDLADLRLKRGALESAQEEIILARDYLKSPPASDKCHLHWSAMVHIFNERVADYRKRGLKAEPISHPLLKYYPENIPCPCDSGKLYRECCFDKHFV